jgi:SAM-dependent methyltransferase
LEGVLTEQKPTGEYKRALQQATAHHARSKTYSGKLMRPLSGVLTDLIERHGVTSILDYGCGKGEQYDWVDPETGQTLEQRWGIDVFKFDPAYPPFAAKPEGQFDLVICTNTLGSIPESDLRSWVIPRLYGHAGKVLFIAERIGQIKKTVHGKGRVAKTSLQWIDLIAPHRRDDVETHLHLTYKTPFGKFGGTFRL